MKDLIELFDKKPELLEINKNSDPYEGHKNSFKKDLLLKQKSNNFQKVAFVKQCNTLSTL